MTNYQVIYGADRLPVGVFYRVAWFRWAWECYVHNTRGLALTAWGAYNKASGF